MRYITVVLAVVVVSSILVASAVIYVDSEDSRSISKELKEKYDIEGFWKEMEENGLSTFHPGRLWPGSIDTDVGSPVAGSVSDSEDVPFGTVVKTS